MADSTKITKQELEYFYLAAVVAVGKDNDTVNPAISKEDVSMDFANYEDEGEDSCEEYDVKFMEFRWQWWQDHLAVSEHTKKLMRPLTDKERDEIAEKYSWSGENLWCIGLNRYHKTYARPHPLSLRAWLVWQVKKFGGKQQETSNA